MVIYIDLDDCLNYYTKAILSEAHAYCASNKAKIKGATTAQDIYDLDIFPQAELDFFSSIKPNRLGIAVVQMLKVEGNDVYILTAPSVKNTHCYIEKAEWVARWLGEEWVEKLIICNNKGLLSGDILVDDNTEGRGIEKFKGLGIHFTGNWIEVYNKINSYIND